MREPGLIAAGSDEPGRILLVGVARSGTTWLGRALAKAQGVRYYHEPDNIDPFTPVWDLAFSGRFPFTLRGEGPWLRPAARLALRVPPRIRDPLVRRAAAVSRRAPQRPRQTVVKTIYALLSLDWLVDRYQPRVVGLQRHPYNVISSWRQLRIPLFDLATRPAVRSGFLEPQGLEPPLPGSSELATIAWHVGLLTHVLGDAADRHPEWEVIDHEDLCVDPVSKMHALCDRVGLTWTDGVEAFLTESDRPGEGLEPVRVTTEQPERWRQRLDDAEVAEIQEVLERFPRRGWVRQPAGVAS
jgi:hypothetical protein